MALKPLLPLLCLMGPVQLIKAAGMGGQLLPSTRLSLLHSFVVTCVLQRVRPL